MKKVTVTEAGMVLSVVKRSEKPLSDLREMRRAVEGNTEAENWLEANEFLFRNPVSPLKSHAFSPVSGDQD